MPVAAFEPQFMKVGVLTAALQELTPRAVRDADPDKAIEDWIAFARELGADNIQLSAALHPSRADVPPEAMLDPVANTLDLRAPFYPPVSENSRSTVSCAQRVGKAVPGGGERDLEADDCPATPSAARTCACASSRRSTSPSRYACAIGPKDYLTWLLEVAPAVIGIVVLAVTRKRFPLTPLAYWLILAHSVILIVGGHYTYAEVPLGEWAREAFSMSRNNYDKLGHFAQGFVPAIIAREILVRLRLVAGRYWRDFFVVCVCLAISAFYELIEWWVALVSEQAAESFLGTQGYAWDTQSDIAWALSGAVLALVCLSRLHDRQLGRFL